MKKQIAIFGGGCFWCTEAVFASLQGVISVVPGYAGGNIENPTYEQVCTGTTGHVEVAKIEFDADTISFETLLDVFFATHDPTTLNQQGNDVGTQYRSVIFYTSAEQKNIAEKYIKKLQANFVSEIVTTVEPLEKFYLAENYHMEYYKNHQNAPYCQVVINPKLKKLREKFAKLLK